MVSNLLTRAPLPTCVRVSTVLVILSLASMAQSSHTGGTDPRVGGGSQSHAAPEIDPGLAAGGIVLLVGGTLVLVARRRLARA